MQAAPAMATSEIAAMEPEVKVFVAEEQMRYLSVEKSMLAANFPAMTTTAEIMLVMVPEVLLLERSMPAATVQVMMSVDMTELSAGGRVQVENLPLP